MLSHPKSNFFPDSFHRVTVKALVVKNGKVLLIKESPELSGKWELPGGGLDFGEEIHEGLKREVEEEKVYNLKFVERVLLAKEEIKQGKGVKIATKDLWK